MDAEETTYTRLVGTLSPIPERSESGLTEVAEADITFSIDDDPFADLEATRVDSDSDERASLLSVDQPVDAADIEARIEEAAEEIADKLEEAAAGSSSPRPRR